MSKKLLLTVFFAAQIFLLQSLAVGETIAYWRFEEGPADAQVLHGAGEGQFAPDIPDASGNGNDLSVWNESFAGYGFRSEVGYDTVPYTGQANNFSVKNTGSSPGMFTQTGSQISTIEPSEFTIEATFRLENGGYRGIINRDSQGSVTGDAALSALYFQAIPENGVAIKFCDVQGYWHDAISETGVIETYDWGTNPSGAGVPFYSMAAVSDGEFLSLYLYNHDMPEEGYKLVAQENMLEETESTNTALTSGTGDGGDWDAGNWTVGRALFNGGHVDRAWGYIDEVRISNSALRITDLLQGPTPYNGGVSQESDPANSDVNVTFSWDAPGEDSSGDGSNAVEPDLVDQYVFISSGDEEDPVLYYAGATGSDPGTDNPASSFGPVDLSYDTSYHWAVVGVMDGYEQSLTPGVSTLADADPNNNIHGPVWEFDAMASVPVIDENPEYQVVADGEDASFTVEVTSVTAPSFQWYKSEDQASDTPEDDTALNEPEVTLDISQHGTTYDCTMFLPAAALADEGYYYCEVTNESSVSAFSDAAQLEIERLLHWYEFENNIMDSQGTNHGVSMRTDPNAPFDYTEGMVGDAISLNAESVGDSFEIDWTLKSNFTIEMWVKTTATPQGGDNWWEGAGLVDGELPGWSDDLGAVYLDGKFALGVGDPDDGNITLKSNTDLNDGTWHYCVATRDYQTGEIKVFVDGVLETETVAPAGLKQGGDNIRIGAIQTGSNFFKGQLDEVKIYNYQLSELDIAQKYTTVTGETVCFASQRPDEGLDTNNDCQINIDDFMVMASEWLVSGIYPAD
ncbi:LamG-like jellyroll fold domain-containing protein [Sedimentisphaera salicampi]|uniref:LamG-like jellyroll fold domain-containing protein n=1 Tax=Sedimentisphaera salicampi TaxID=1941349 RepID=UPI000B9CA0CD|nr:LamG-like jellyroll fold domain-containing protein [Sedimentisphaera salicampi]OXU16152.1 Immunoglobulin I-set domain protein [Sedimentisphaera salicampi]